MPLIRVYFFTLLLVGMLPIHPALGQDWPQFRGINGNASSDDLTPIHWSGPENIAWKTELPGRGASSPIVVGDKIFLTAYSGYGIKGKPLAKTAKNESDEASDTENKQRSRPAKNKNANQRARRNRNRKPALDYGDKSKLRLHTLCFDRDSGKLIWNKSIAASADEQPMKGQVQGHGYTSGTPASDGKTVFAYFGVSGLVAYDLEGNELWKRDDFGSKTAGFGSASSPVVDDEFVFVNASIESGTLFALNKATGEVEWKRENVEKSWSTPCLAKTNDGKTELVINQKFTVYGLDPKTGSELWSCSGIEDYIVPVPVVHDGIIYCLGGRGNKAMAIKLGGRGDVTETHRLWYVGVGANVTSPVYHDGYLYWASDKAIANCMDATNGESVYRERMPTKARVYASIVRGGNHLYLTTRDNGVWVLPAEPKFEELALNKIETDESMFNASPAISNGQLLLRTDKFLYCIGNKN